MTPHMGTPAFRMIGAARNKARGTGTASMFINRLYAPCARNIFNTRSAVRVGATGGLESANVPLFIRFLARELTNAARLFVRGVMTRPPGLINCTRRHTATGPPLLPPPAPGAVNNTTTLCIISVKFSVIVVAAENCDNTRCIRSLSGR